MYKQLLHKNTQSLITLFLVISSLFISINFLYHPTERSLVDEPINAFSDDNIVSSNTNSLTSSGGGDQVISVENILDQPSKTEEEGYYAESIDTEKEYERETVKVDIQARDSVVDDIKGYTSHQNNDSETGGLVATYSQDGISHFINSTGIFQPAINLTNSIWFLGDNPVIQVWDHSIIYSITSPSSNGLITTRMRANATYDRYGSSTSGYTDLRDFTVSPDPEYINDGNILLRVSAQLAVYEYWLCSIVAGIMLYNYANNSWVVQKYTTAVDFTGGAYSAVMLPKVMSLFVDYINYEPDLVSSNIRSNLKYYSETNILHTLKIENYAYSTKINIYAPLAWNLTSISPDCDFEYDSSSFTWNLTKTEPVNYILNFYSGIGWGVDYARQAQYLAASDHSLDYAQDFESGTDNDFFDSTWSTDSANWADNIELRTDIVMEGAFAMELSDSGSYARAGMNLPYGEYYISFSYYIEDWDGALDIFNFGYRTDSWQYINLDQTAANRWNTAFIFVQPTETSTSELLFSINDASDFTVIIDAVKVMVSNSKFETVGYSHNRGIAQMISLDAYECPAVSNLETIMQLRDRTSNELIKEVSRTTDEQGFVYWDYRGSLEQKEYSLFVVANSADAYNPLDFDSSDFSLTDRSPTLEGDTIIDTSEGIGGSAYFDGTGDYVAYTSSFLDVGADEYTVSIWFKTDNSTIDRHCLVESTGQWAISIELTTWHYLQAYASTSDVHGLVHSNVAYNDDTWHNVVLTYREGEALLLYVDGELKDTDTAMTGDLDAVPSLNLGTYRYASGRFFEGYLDEFRFYEKTLSGSEIQGIYNLNIPNAKSYFTPQTASSIDYATSQGNAWDFTEGFDDNWGTIVTGETVSISDGKYIQEGNRTDILTYTYVGYDSSFSIDASFFTHFEMRFRLNTSLDKNIILYDGHWANPVHSTVSTWSADIWYIFKADLSQDSDWAGTETDFMILFQNYSTFVSALKIEIDYISILHQDSSIGGGYAVEFNEPNYNEGYTCSAFSDLTTSNGWLTGTCHTGMTNMYLTSVPYSFFAPSENAQVLINIETSETDLIILLYAYKVGGGSTSSPELEISAGNNFYLLDIGSSGFIYFDFSFKLRQDTGTTSGDEVISFNFIRMVYSNAPNLQETPSSYFMSSENDTLQYQVFNDFQSRGSYQDLELVNLNLSVASHSFSYAAYNDLDVSGCYLPSAFYYNEYTITETDLCSIIIHDQIGNWVDARQFVIKIDGARIYGDTFLVSDTSSIFSLEIEDFWGTQLYYNAAETYVRFIDLQLSIYECVLVNLVDEDVKGQIKPSSESTWYTLTIPEGHWRYLYLYTSTYDIRFIDLDDNVLRLYSSQTISSDVIYEIKHFPDLIVYNYDYSYNPDGSGNMSLEIMSNYELLNISVWDDGVYKGQWTSPENITWVLNSVNGSHLVYFEVSRWITKITNETQTRAYIFTYTIGEVNELQATCSTFHDQTTYNISISANTQDAGVSIWHDGSLIEWGSLERNFGFAKNGEIGLHNVTVKVFYMFNTSLSWWRYWTFTYFVEGYKQAFRFSTSVSGFNLDNAYISLDYLTIYLDGVYVKPTSPAWFEDPEQTDEINNSCVDGGFVYVTSTVRNHTVVVKDLWGQIIDTLTIDLFSGDYVTYSLPLYKLTLLNDTDEERGYKMSKYTSSTGLYEALEIISIPANSLHTIWIVDSTYQIRFYDAVERTVYQSGQTIIYRDWEYSEGNPIYTTPENWVWVHIPFSKFIVGDAEGESFEERLLKIIFFTAAMIILLGLLGFTYLIKKKGEPTDVAAGKAIRRPLETGLEGGFVYVGDGLYKLMKGDVKVKKPTLKRSKRDKR